MAQYKFTVVVAQMHAVALAITEIPAVRAFPCLHPCTVTIWLIPVLPDIDEVILIYISLGEIASDAGAGGYRAVYHHRADAHARLASEHVVAHLALILPQESFAAVARVDASLLARLPDELHQATETLVAELKLGILSRSSHRKDSEKTPALQAERNQVLLELWQGVVVSVIDTCHDIELDLRFVCKDPDGLGCISETAFHSTHPFMLRLEAVKTDGGRVKPCTQESVDLARCHKKAVRDYSPREFHVVDGPSALFYVLAHERFASRDHDHHLVRVVVILDAAEHLRKILERHVLMLSRDLAVASAMAAFHVAAQSTLPEELPERVLLSLIQNELPLKFECKLLFDRQS